MSEYFFAYINKIPKELHNTMFSIQHIMALLAVATAGIVLALLFSKKSQEAKWRMITYVSFVLPIMEIAQVIWYKAIGHFSWGYTLPLHLCSLMCIILPIMALTKKEILIEYAYAMGLAPALLALITPDVYYYPSFSFIYIQTMIVHGIICFVPIYIVVCMGFRPNIRRLPKVIAMLIVLAIIIIPINQITNGNYFFLRYPAPGSPMEAFSNVVGSPWYLIPTFMLGCILWGIMYLPFAISTKVEHQATL